MLVKYNTWWQQWQEVELQAKAFGIILNNS
jgi:hypothetical protein